MQRQVHKTFGLQRLVFLKCNKAATRQQSRKHRAFRPTLNDNGLFLPYPTMALMSTYITGRFLYNQGYVEKENVLNRMRVAGAVMCHGSTAGTLGMTFLIGVGIWRGRARDIMRFAAFAPK